MVASLGSLIPVVRGRAMQIDRVTSCFGVIFAPRQPHAAALQGAPVTTVALVAPSDPDNPLQLP